MESRPVPANRCLLWERVSGRFSKHRWLGFRLLGSGSVELALVFQFVGQAGTDPASCMSCFFLFAAFSQVWSFLGPYT